LPAHWPSFRIYYRYRDTPYHIVVTQGPATDGKQTGEVTVVVDGVPRPDAAVPLVDDRQEHTVEVRAGKNRAGDIAATEASARAI
jgi:cellobiose phosphorylase